MTNKAQMITPPAVAGIFNNRIRRWLQNPKKILNPYVKPGMKVLDLGCGPGFFTIAISQLLKGNGKVIGVDIQREMLIKAEKHVRKSPFPKTIELHQSNENSIGLEKLKQNSNELKNSNELNKSNELKNYSELENSNVNKDKFDFILAFWSVHEIVNKNNYYLEIKSLLKEEGKLFIAEPKNEVNIRSFNKMINDLEDIGFIVEEWVKVSLSRAIILSIRKQL